MTEAATGIDRRFGAIEMAHGRLPPGLARDAETRRRARQHLARRLIADRLRCRPSELTFTRSPNGKPEARAAPFWVSWSYADDHVVVGFSHDGPLGVDAAAMEPLPEFDGLIERFAGDAKAAIRAAPDRKAAFYRWWTRLEAAVKAEGLRLADVLDSGDGDALLHNVPARRVDVHPDLMVHVALGASDGLRPNSFSSENSSCR